MGLEQLIKIGEPFPREQEQLRINEIKENELLFRGNHYRVFEGEFLERLNLLDKKYKTNIVKEFVGSEPITSAESYITIENFPAAISALYADLCFGKAPDITTDDKDKEKWLADFLKDQKFNILLHTGALIQSYKKDCIYKVSLNEGKAEINLIPTEYYFAIPSSRNAFKVEKDVLAWKVKTDNDSVEILRVEIHSVGTVEYKAFQMVDGEVKKEIEWDNELLGEAPSNQIETTDIARSLVFKIPNMMLDNTLYGLSDYQGAKTLFRDLDIRLSQIGRILDKHAAPNMFGSELNVNENEDTKKLEVKTDTYYIVGEGEVAPGYLVWDGQLESAFKTIKEIKEGIYISTDTNEAAFTMSKEGGVLSGTAIKKVLFRTLSRTERKKMFWEGNPDEMIEIAYKLETKGDIDVKVKYNIGLPRDEKEEAQIAQIRTGNKATQSVSTSIKRQDGLTEEQTEEEIVKIDADQKREEGTIGIVGAGFNLGEDEEVEEGA